MDKLGNIIHEIESSVDTFVKESGIHQGPPELYRDVFRKMAEVYGAHVWAMVDLNLKMNPKNPSFLELRDYVSQFADSPRRYKSARKVRIPINLDNWKPYEQLKELMPRCVEFINQYEDEQEVKMRKGETNDDSS